MRKSLGAAILVLMAGPALAADKVEARIGAAHKIDWSGFYAGLRVGGAFGSDDSSGGAVGGAVAGYNWQFNNTVAGFEAGVSVADIAVAPGVKLSTLVDLRGRLGLTVTDDVLVYGTGGGAWAPNSGPDGGSAGFAAGAGIDWAAAEKLIWGVEYVHYKFRNFADTGNTLDVDLVQGKITYHF